MTSECPVELRAMGTAGPLRTDAASRTAALAVGPVVDDEGSEGYPVPSGGVLRFNLLLDTGGGSR